MIKDPAEGPCFQAMDRTLITELLHPERHGIGLDYSVAHALLRPGASSLPHRLRSSSEVYLILEGVGEMRIDSERATVRAGQAVLIPAGSVQHLRNTGDMDLKFFCIVSPFWRAEDEEMIHEERNSE